MAIKWSRDQGRHLTPKDLSRHIQTTDRQTDTRLQYCSIIETVNLVRSAKYKQENLLYRNKSSVLLAEILPEDRSDPNPSLLAIWHGQATKTFNKQINHLIHLYFLFQIFLICKLFLPRDALQCKARYCDRMSSVCPSVRPSVTLVDCDHIGWNSSKIVSPLVSL